MKNWLMNIHLAPGDSGAWIFDKPSGRVCGHVLAWSGPTRTTYIAPMDIMLEDIARSLNASRVTLPAKPTETATTTAAAAIPALLPYPQPFSAVRQGSDRRGDSGSRRKSQHTPRQRIMPLPDLISLRRGAAAAAWVDRSLRAGV